MRRLFGFGQVIASAIPVPGAVHLIDRSEASPSLSIFRKMQDLELVVARPV